MIKAENYFDAVPEHLQKDQKRCEFELLSRKKFNNSCWRDCKTELLQYFHQKCAYCERPFLTEQDCSIDHYRPKAHYYWLAHEWTNLLPACRFCQKTKDKHFETENTKQSDPPLHADGSLDYARCRADHEGLLAEKSLFLHPVLDHAHEHLWIQIAGKKRGKMQTKTEKGEYSCRYYNLNEQMLLRERKDLITNFLDQLAFEESKFAQEGVPQAFLRQAALESIAPLLVSRTKTEFSYSFVWQNIGIFFGILTIE